MCNRAGEKRNTGRGAFGAAALFVAMCAAALLPSQKANAAIVAIDSVQQRWPWNNKVDITYTVTGDDLASKVGKVRIIAVVNGLTYIAYDDPIGAAKVGTFTVTWNDPPPGVKSEDCKMFATIQTSRPVRSGDDYMIIDLATGAVTYEGLFTSEDVLDGVSGQELSNARYNQDKYKSTHYVLRKVPKGTYKTGDNVNCGTDNTEKTWTTDKVFYMGVFPWTSYQYWYVFDLYDPARDHSQQDLRARPLGLVRDIRGSADQMNAPAQEAINSKWHVIKGVNGKTHMNFDIPTEVMHEIATRAGTETPYFWGSDSSLAPQYAVYGLSGGRPGGGWNFNVGSKKANPWGLYDMVGLDWEWCLDSYVADLGTAAVVDPWGGASGNRIMRGGAFYLSEAYLASSARNQNMAANQRRSYSGARLFIVVP